MPSSLDSLIASLVAQLTGPDIAGIALVGSYARGTVTPYSDVDIDLYVDGPRAEWKDRVSLRRHECYLISISRVRLEEGRQALQVPVDAIEAVPGLCDMRILYDPRGALAALQEEARGFSWAPLQKAGDEYAATILIRAAEAVHKILGALSTDNASSLSYATGQWFLPNITRAVAVHHGVLVQSVNELYSTVQEAVGEDSQWTRLHRIVAGMDEGGGLRERGLAALELYVETSNMFLAILAEEQLDVSDGTVKRIRTYIQSREQTSRGE